MPDMPALQVRLEQCVNGRLRAAYPVNAHDVEVRISDGLGTAELTEALGEAARDALRTDPHCRRVVFAAPAGDLAAVATAEAAGFRYVVDVDIPGAELSLLVAEPGWVTAVDMDLDRVPDT
jgi:hypothetical protein